MTEVAKGVLADDGDRKRAAEEQVAKAVALLRDELPDNFILLYEKDQTVFVHGAFSLNSAQRMFKAGIEEVSHQYAYDVAKTIGVKR